MISGTQGEPMSALSRAAVNNHKFAKIDAGDTVLMSSRVIPGNEKGIYRVIDHLERRDANVIFDDGSNGMIHVSGHGSQEELKLMINLVQPKFFIPVHGDYRHLKHHAALAEVDGRSEEGDPGGGRRRSGVHGKDTVSKNGKVTTGRVCIDSGGSIDVVDDVVIKDRQHLSEDGIVLAIIAIDKRTGQSRRRAGDCDARVCGGRCAGRWRGKGDCAADAGGSSAEEKQDYGVIKEKIRGDLKRFIQKATSRRPLIMPVIMEI